MKAAFLALGAAILIIFVAAVALTAVVFFGYGVGLAITLIPFLSTLLVGGPITVSSIPVITAWIAVAGSIISLFSIKFNVSATSHKPTVKKIETITK